MIPGVDRETTEADYLLSSMRDAQEELIIKRNQRLIIVQERAQSKQAADAKMVKNSWRVALCCLTRTAEVRKINVVTEKKNRGFMRVVDET